MCCNCVNRREFMAITSATVVGASLAAMGSSSETVIWDPEKPIINTSKTLRLQPVLMCTLPQRREQTSWRPWGAFHTKQDIAEEKIRITTELNTMKKKAEFPLQVLPLVHVTNEEEASQVRDKNNYDVMLVYAATGGGDILEKCYREDKNNLMFVRHRSGPVYLWYEIAHCRFLRKGGEAFEVDEYRQPAGMDFNDVIVDEYDDLLLTLRSINGINNFVGNKIVALGGAGGWCCPKSPDVAKNKFQANIIDVSYDELGKRIKIARADKKVVNQTKSWAKTYLALPETKLQTDLSFVENGFLLYKVFKDLLNDYGANAFTIQNCMGTVMPMSETTACLPLSLLNDEGYLAFCESDFNVIPAGILMHYVSGKPVFLNDPTYPHHNMVTCAHCTAPRRMDGKNYAPALVVTHFESDYGATPKVNLPNGSPVTMICPDAGQKEWVGFTGKIIDSPFYDICRSQYDIEIDGNWKKLLSDMRGFHWQMVVGDYSKELAYAVNKVGVKWNNISAV